MSTLDTSRTPKVFYFTKQCLSIVRILHTDQPTTLPPKTFCQQRQRQKMHHSFLVSMQFSDHHLDIWWHSYVHFRTTIWPLFTTFKQRLGHPTDQHPQAGQQTHLHKFLQHPYQHDANPKWPRHHYLPRHQTPLFVINDTLPRENTALHQLRSTTTLHTHPRTLPINHRINLS